MYIYICRKWGYMGITGFEASLLFKLNPHGCRDLTVSFIVTKMELTEFGSPTLREIDLVWGLGFGD